MSDLGSTLQMRSLVESDKFDLAWTLIDEPAKADTKLEDLFCRIAVRAESFPIVVYPNERMAMIKNDGQTIGVFFSHNAKHESG